MAHEVESLGFVGERPWHGIGIEMPTHPDVVTAFQMAGLTWTTHLEPLYRKYEKDLGSGLKETVEVKTAVKAVIRDDKNSELGIVHPGYTLYQNADMQEWLRPFVEGGDLFLEVGGSLRHGKRTFMLGRMAKDPIDVVPGDPVSPYLLFANGFDGTFAAHVGFTPTRVVCANTLAAALDDEYSRILRVFHTKDIQENVKEIAGIVDLANRNFVASIEQYQALANRGMDTLKLKAFVRMVFFPKLDGRKNKDVKKVEEEAAVSVYEKVVPLFEHGRGNDMKGVAGTWWAGLNAVGEYLAYERGRSVDARVSSLWFGEGSNLNRRALKTAVAMGLN